MIEPEKDAETLRTPPGQPAEHAAGKPEVGSSIDDFLLVDHLGEGAFAKVYLAHQKSLHRTVALKISKERSEEAQTLAQLDHPNIVRVYDERRARGRELRLLYMEYVPGGTLEDVIRRARSVPAEARSGRLVLDAVDAALSQRGEEPPLDSMLRARLQKASWPEAVGILGAQLATALDYAHGQGVLHRDVKPANVLLAPSGRARLADFNISFSSRLEGARAAEYLGGSLPYMAPEQLAACSPYHEGAAEDLDERSDIYGLGMLLWELLAGSPPLPGPTPGAAWKVQFADLVGSRRAGVPASAVADLPRGTPEMLIDVLRACLDPDPARRPVSGARLARRLELCLHPRVRALLSPAPRGWRAWIRRIPLSALLLTALAPNAFLSLLNIRYNLKTVVEKSEWSDFWTQVSVVNGVAFPLGIAVLVWWAWPIAAAVRRTAGDPPPRAQRERLRLRALRIGDLAVGVVLPLWILGGLVFPIWHHAYAGEAHEGGYFHFTLSNLMFGVLAATACFFLIGFLVMRVLLPRLAVPGDVDLRAGPAMARLASRSVVYFAACTAVPFVSVVVLATQAGQLRGAYAALGVMGVLGFGASYWLHTEIRKDLDALAYALRPRLAPEDAQA